MGASSLTALLLALTLAGCGGGESESATTAEPTTEAVAPDPTGEATATSGATVGTTQEQHDALDRYVALEQAQMEATFDAVADVYSKVAITAAYPDTIEFSYVYSEQVDPQWAHDQLESMRPTLQTLCETRVFPDMEATGVTPSQKANYSYYNADGSVLWTHTFES